MSILSVMRDTSNNASNITIVRMITTDPMETILQPNWLESQKENIKLANAGAEFEFLETDALFLRYGNQNDIPSSEYFFYLSKDLKSILPMVYLYPNSGTALTAHAGGGQANATKLGIGTNVVTTVASNTDSVKLPLDVLGQTVMVFNNTSNTLSIFPSEGDQIDTLGIDVRLNVGANSKRTFIGISTNDWVSFAAP